MSIHLFSAVVRLSTTAALALGLSVVAPESASAVSSDLATRGTASASSISSDVLGESSTSATASEEVSTTASSASFGVCEEASDDAQIDATPAFGPNSELPRCNSVVENVCADAEQQNWCACRAAMGMVGTYKCGCKVSVPPADEIGGELPLP